MALCSGVAASPALSAEQPTCKTVRFSDVGWTDITATTGLASRVLTGLGYTPKSEILAVPVTYTSMKNKDIDVFLGNWMPTMEADRKPYIDDKSVEIVGVNLTGAKYTLAVLETTWNEGLKDFKDIPKFKAKLGLYFFARLMEFGLSATRSGAIACAIAEKASLDQYSEADRIILVQGTDYSEVFGSLIKSYSGDVTVGYDPDHITKGFYYAGLGTVIFTVDFYISHVRKLLDEKIERERNILGEEEE
jgi:ABC-type proline/glycine betaine transport system substrate-binding protein